MIGNGVKNAWKFETKKRADPKGPTQVLKLLKLSKLKPKLALLWYSFDRVQHTAFYDFLDFEFV